MTLEEQLEHLTARAANVRSLLNLAPRPFVLEFAGSPKSGKSTSVDTVEHFFRRNKFRTHKLRERASFCPIPMKGHLFFNMWCACTMLSEMLENIDTDCELIIKDRGLFDSLLWLRRQKLHGEISKDEAQRIEEFLLMDRWIDLVDLVFVLTVDPPTALAREHAPRISAAPGSIMNEKSLTSINNALQEALQRYSNYFTVKVFDTTDASDPRLTNILIAGEILDRLYDFLNPEIMVVNRSDVAALPFNGIGFFSREGARDALTTLAGKVKYMRRYDAEQSDHVVQVIPCAILMYAGQIFLFERNEKDPKADFHGIHVIWQGTHVPKSHNSVKDQARSALRSRLRQKLFLGRLPDLDLLGYAWDRNEPRSSKHFGLLYGLHIDSDDVAANLAAKEFRSGRGHGLSGKFATREELRTRSGELELEPWSQAALDAGVGGSQ